MHNIFKGFCAHRLNGETAAPAHELHTGQGRMRGQFLAAQGRQGLVQAHVTISQMGFSGVARGSK